MTKQLTAEAVRLMEETVPVATYSCAQCIAEEQDLKWDSLAEQWVCESCYDGKAEEMGLTDDPLCISDLQTFSVVDPDYGTPADGPVWTVVGLYDNGESGVFHIHAADSQRSLKEQIQAAKDADVIGYSFDEVAAFPGALHSEI